MYETIQVIRQTTRFHDSVIICGDFNHQPDELGVEALTKLAYLRDTYEIAENKVGNYRLIRKIKFPGFYELKLKALLLEISWYWQVTFQCNKLSG